MALAEVSPRGIAAYAWLYKKDTKFSKGDDSKAKHKLTLVVDKDAEGITEFITSIQEQHEKNEGREKTCPVKDGDQKTDKDGKANEEFAGKWLVVFSTQYPPTMVDSKKTLLPEGVLIFSGDEVRVAFKRIDYDTGATSGVSLQMGAVQLMKKNASAAGAGAFGDEEEGYVAPATAVAPSSDDGDSNGGDY